MRSFLSLLAVCLAFRQAVLLGIAVRGAWAQGSLMFRFTEMLVNYLLQITINGCYVVPTGPCNCR